MQLQFYGVSQIIYVPKYIYRLVKYSRDNIHAYIELEPNILKTVSQSTLLLWRQKQSPKRWKINNLYRECHPRWLHYAKRSRH